MKASWGFLEAQLVKNLLAMQETLVGFLGRNDSEVKTSININTFLPLECQFRKKRDCVLFTNIFQGSRILLFNMCVYVLFTQFSLTLHDPAGLLCPWNSPGKCIGGGCHSFLQGIFLSQGLNACFLHCMQILYHLSHQGSLGI